MAHPYTRKALAQAIANGHDTASAANLFGRKLRFIQSEQGTVEYERHLNRFLEIRERRTRTIERTAERGFRVT